MPKKDAAAKEDREDQKSSTSLSLERPHRPLNAYNLFFQEERRRMLDRAQVSGGESRFGFGDMARIVSKRWKSISDIDKARFQRLADLEKQRYYREMNVWYAAINDDSNDEAEDETAGSAKKQKSSETEMKESAKPPAADRGTSDFTLPISQSSTGGAAASAGAIRDQNEAASQIGSSSSSRQEPAAAAPAPEISSLIFPSFPDSTNQPSAGYLFQFSEPGGSSSSWADGIENPFSAQQFARSLDQYNNNNSDSKDGAGDSQLQDFIPSSVAGSMLPVSVHPNQTRICQEDMFKSVEGTTSFSFQPQPQLGREEMGAQNYPQQEEPMFLPEASAAPQRSYETQNLLTLSTRRQQTPASLPRRSFTEASRMRLLASRLGPEAVDFVVDAFQDNSSEGSEGHF